MNTLAIINLARRYAKNIVAKNFPDLPKTEVTAKARLQADHGPCPDQLDQGQCQEGAGITTPGLAPTKF